MRSQQGGQWSQPHKTKQKLQKPQKLASRLDWKPSPGHLGTSYNRILSPQQTPGQDKKGIRKCHRQGGGGGAVCLEKWLSGEAHSSSVLLLQTPPNVIPASTSGGSEPPAAGHLHSPATPLPLYHSHSHTHLKINQNNKMRAGTRKQNVRVRHGGCSSACL